MELNARERIKGGFHPIAKLTQAPFQLVSKAQIEQAPSMSDAQFLRAGKPRSVIDKAIRLSSALTLYPAEIGRMISSTSR
jgi:hypothetical protein